MHRAHGVRERGMHANSMLGNREIPEATEGVPPSVRSGKVCGQKPDMYAEGKSDGEIGSMKQANKSAQPRRVGHPLAESVERRAPTKGNPGQATVTGTQRPEPAWSGLTRVREAARKDPKRRFTNLMHHITEELLREAYGSLRRDAAAGVDGVTWAEYGEGLAGRIEELHGRVQSGRYRAKPSKRTWVPKSDGRQRPIGIAALEDKIVQQALVWVLQAIYEEEFLGFSYGSRPGRNQHNALDAVYVAITQRKVNWVYDADIQNFYDSIDHGWLGS